MARRARDSLMEAMVPPALRRRYRSPSPDGLTALAASLEKNYFAGDPGYLTSEEGVVDLDVQLHGQLSLVRRRVAPWLNSLTPLENSSVVEIGCGTGSATVAFAEQGARVTGFDVNADSLAVAAERCRAYGVTADLRQGNAADLPQDVVHAADITIFMASLEHMTLEERLAGLSNTWKALKSGAWLAVVQTPNRLWWFDDHTSFLPFFLWLPEDLAVHYAKFSGRKPFSEDVAPPVDEAMLLRLARTGRSASYHEFQLALGDLSGLEIRGLGRWLRRNPVHWAKWVTCDRAFHRVLSRRAPSGVAPAMCEPYLELAIRKP
jgi:S-adenosylmethionine-dependent methyltransferase